MLMTTMTTTTTDLSARGDGPIPVTYADRFVEPQTSRPMPPPLPAEPAGYRWAWLAVGLGVSLLFAAVVFRFYAPADAGVDQNAYLVGGRLIAQHHTTEYVLPVVPVAAGDKSPNPGGYAYTGGMFVRMPNGTYFPKYPAGLPLLYAAFFWLFGPTRGPVWAFVVSPASAVAAVLGTFFLARSIAGSFAGVMAAVLLGTSQVMLSLADNPNSHAACTACIVWGMFLLVRWWQTGSIWQGVLAGLLVGYAFTIRYTEGLLVLPIAVACLTRIRWGHWTPWVLASGIGAAGVSFMLLIGLYTMPDWADAHGVHHFFGPGKTGHAAVALAASGYAIACVIVVLFAAVTFNRPVWWRSFLNRIGWELWRCSAQGIALGATSLIALGTLIAVAWAAVLVVITWPVLNWGHITSGDATVATTWSGLGTIGQAVTIIVFAALVYSATIGALSAAAAGLNRAWLMSFLRNVLPGLAWCLPVVTLLVYNAVHMGHAAGYDTTHESEIGVAFQWKFVARNWEMVVRTFDDLELFFVVPFALAGLAMVFRRSWRVGVLLLAWLVPGVLLYASYYWSMDFDVAYARFYLTFVPALCVAAAVAFHDGVLGGRTGGRTAVVGDGHWRAWAPAVQVSAAAAVVVAVVLLARLWTASDWDLNQGVHHWIGVGKTGPLVAALALAAYAAAAVAVVVVAAHRAGSLGWNTWAALASRVPAIMAVGLVVGVSSGVSAYRALHGLRDGTTNLIPLIENYRQRLNLARVGTEMLGKHAERPAGQTRGWVWVDNVPAHSVVFSSAGGGIASPTNYTQFLGDWDVYPSDAFNEDGSRRGFGGGGNRNRGNNNRGGANGRGNNGGGNRGGFLGFGGGNRGGPPGGGPGGPPGAGGNTADDQDQVVATPVQPEQQDYHASLYRGVTRRQLYDKQGQVVQAAFAAGHKVFAIVTKDQLGTFEDDMDEAGRTAHTDYDFKLIAAWSDVALPVDRDDEATAAADRSNRWGGGNRGGRAGGGRGGFMGGGGMARLMGLEDQKNDWRLVEVVPAAAKARK